ncbi:stress response protein SCP2 [Anaerobacterium chartisolvens]|uniref:Stress response protein SCP2 n=1 Tax=Anaerobacterium chartisolvens TaxID=1297424 RepID=A0A369B7V2_9FIRM|nr:TerD family protein [Anaerobacterium chartisolvens]RCX17600.1 stress response protein SCP2 [Anaerobacterium chartisolvens]
MAVNLKKGEKVNLSKCDKKLKRILVGLRWREIPSFKGQSVDCDAFAILLDKDKKLMSGNDVVYHANLEHSSKSVLHGGDNLKGSNTASDCEQIFVELSKIPQQVHFIVFAVSIYKAEEKKQDFGVVEGARVQVLNAESNETLCIYDLTDSYSKMTSVIVAELCRAGDGWCFHAVGQGTCDKGIGDVFRRYR